MNKTLEINQKLEIDQQLLDMRGFHSWASFEVTKQHDAEVCAERLGIIAQHRKQIETQRDKVIKPLKEATRAFEAMVRDALRPLNHIDEILRHRLSKFMDNRQRELEAEAKAKREAALAAEKAMAKEAMNLAIETGSEVATAEVEQRAKNIERLSENPIDVRQTLRLERTTVAQALVWEWKVTDESKIPREYLVIDELQLNKLARCYSKLDPKPEIPGIEFQQKTRLSVMS